MDERFIIYCDESDSKGRFYSNFYGGAIIKASKQEAIEHELQIVKDKLGIGLGEIKWQKITQPYANKYADFVDAIFDIVERGDIKFRIMFTQNIHVANLSEYQVGQEYFLLYYQFIKHAFGLKYSTSENNKASATILLDDIPHNAEKLHDFKEYLSSLSLFPIWKRAGFSIAYENITDVDSKKHNILQALDLILGGMQSRLNEKHTKPIPPAKRRSKRAIAKEIVYKKIYSRISKLYPNFNVGVSTATPDGQHQRFEHPYRHWLFIPSDAKIDSSKTKKTAGLRK